MTATKRRVILRPMASTSPPWRWALAGALCGGAIVAAELSARDGYGPTAEERPLSAERTAERYLMAWSTGQEERARALSSGTARQAASGGPGVPPPFGPNITIVFEESHRIDDTAVMLQASVEVLSERVTKHVAQLILEREDDRWQVRDVSWPTE
jgi:hypothetical protein